MSTAQNCDITSGKCVPCEGGVVALERLQAQTLLLQTPGWVLTPESRAISRHYQFKNFKQALAFVNKVGEIAEKEGHHPDITFGWGYVQLLFTTHSIGGLHNNDFIMAGKVNALDEK